MWQVLNDVREVSDYIMNRVKKCAIGDTYSLRFASTNVDVVNMFAEARKNNNYWRNIPKPCNLATDMWYFNGYVTYNEAKITEIHKSVCFVCGKEILVPNINYGKKTYGFSFLDDDTDYREHLPYHWENDNPAPRKTSCPSEKTLMEWVDWLTERKSVAEAIKQGRKNKIEKFIKKVKSIATEGDIIRENSGEIHRGGLVFKWVINGENLDHTIELSHKLSRYAEIDKFIEFTNGVGSV